ncbi:hypothetical protein HAX54_009081 [Datura stramonium]|uniref:Uncharacterized protein n=1 Tax=Datura stramonium TaxID=4076 RepID=A0ABS8RY79_DATST|nr:hypothetical protein [Datura stramonium]
MTGNRAWNSSFIDAAAELDDINWEVTLANAGNTLSSGLSGHRSATRKSTANDRGIRGLRNGHVPTTITASVMDGLKKFYFGAVYGFHPNYLVLTPNQAVETMIPQMFADPPALSLAEQLDWICYSYMDLNVLLKSALPVPR